MNKYLLLMTCATSALGLMAGAAQAATATATATDNSQNATSVTELVVTAERREQSLQKIPVAVSVFTGAQRDVIGISSVADVTNFAPGFTYDPGNVHAFIRGVGRQSVNVTDDQRVANYEDEFYVYSPYGLDKSSLFLSQEQIERGPQNVGGRNAAAGSIDMISVRPTDQPYGEVRATVANFGTYNVEGAVSGQVAPGLDLRLAAFDHNQDDGYYQNILPGRSSEGNRIHEWYVEGQADWKPNDKFEFWSRAFAEAWDGNGDAGSRLGFYNGSWDETSFTDANAYTAAGLFVNPNYGLSAPNGNPTAFANVQAFNNATLTANALSAHPSTCALCLVQPIVTSVSLYAPGILNNPSALNSNQYASPIARQVKLDGYDDFNYIATYHFDGFDFKYTGGIQGYNYFLKDPGDGEGENTSVKSFTLASAGLPGEVPLTINPFITASYTEDDWWTNHDFTLQSTTDGPLQWTAGAFYYFQHYNQPYQVTDALQPQLANPICLAANLCGIAGAGAPANPSNTIGYFDYKFNVESIAGYGETSYKITDQIKVTGDIRYTWDDKWGVENTRYIDFNSTDLLTPITVAPGVAEPLYLLAGAATPSVDITALETCLTGTGVNNLVSASCTTGPLAPGVRSKGVILPNGYAQRQLGITSDAVTGGAEIEWTPTPDIFTYFRYGRGYEAPSFNAGQVIGNPAVKPEYLNSYEVGYKESFGKQLLIDAAVFYYDYEGLQVPITITNGGLTQSQFANVPKSVSTGVELEAYWTPVKDLSVTASYSYDYTAVETSCTNFAAANGPNNFCLQDTNDPAAVQPGAKPVPGQTFVPGVTNIFQSLKGNPLPDAPENKFAIDVAYTWHFEPGSLTFSGTYAYRGAQLDSLFDRSYNTAPSWDDVDLRALWKGPNDKYEIIAYAKNLFNSLQYTTGAAGAGLAGSTAVVSAASGLNEISGFELNPPRTYGVEVRYKFF